MEKKKSKKKKKAEGLGDSIAKVTELLYLDKLAQFVAESMGEDDCGCTRRKEKLNELFPYKDKHKEE
jgi:hypothetical protein